MDKQERASTAPIATFEVTQEFTVPLDPLASENPKFAKVKLPIPMTDEQKKRLKAFIESL